MPDVPQQEEVDVSMEIKAQNKIVCLATSEPQVFDFSKFKTMNQCIRHVAFVKRFFNNCRVPAAARKTGGQCVSELLRPSKNMRWNINIPPFNWGY